MNLNGKTALVTGSTSGIGLGIAKVLAQAGAQLVLNGFGDSTSARAEVAALGKIPGYHDADLRDVGQIEAMMRYTESEFGGVDIVINTPVSSMWRQWSSSRWKNGTIFWR